MQRIFSTARLYLLAPLMFFMLASSYQSLAQDTSRKAQAFTDTLSKRDHAYPQSQIAEKPDDEFNIFLMVFGLAAVCFMMGFFIVGMFLFLFLLFVFLLFIAGGIVSTSIFVALYKRSFSSGFKLLMVAGGGFIGLVCGIIGFGFVSYLFDLDLERSTINISGSLIGLLIGLLLGLMLFKILKTVLSYFKKRLKILID